MQNHTFVSLIWLCGCGSVTIAPMPGDAGQQNVLVDDLAADFGGQGSVASGADATDDDLIAPYAYWYGGLLLDASNGLAFNDGATTTWADVRAMPTTGSRAVGTSLFEVWGFSAPLGVGVDDDVFTLRYQGEIYLDVAVHTFHLLADDHAFIEIAPPGTQEFVRIVSANYPIESTGPFSVTSAGWYPVRVAMADTGSGAQLLLRQAIGDDPPLPIPGARLRFRADHLRGMHMAAWDDAFAVGAYSARIDERAPAAQDWGRGIPGDLGLSDPERFTVRWSGQVRLAAGTYAFHLSTDDGQRLWVDGNELIDHWDNITHSTTSPRIFLSEGWHDIVVDQTDNTGGAHARLSVMEGPELGGMSRLPLDRLRPVLAHGPYHATAVDRGEHAIPDLASAVAVMPLSAPAGAKVERIDVSVSVNHGNHGDLEIRVIAPSGAEALIRDRTGAGTSGSFVEHVSTRALAGIAVDGTWRIRVNDTGAGNTGTLLDAQLTVHYLGGNRAVVPERASFDSGIEDLGEGVSSIDTLAWKEVVPAGSRVLLRVRTGATVEECMAAPWSGALDDADGSTPLVAAGRYLQYRIEFESDGLAYPWVDWVRIEYTTAE